MKFKLLLTLIESRSCVVNGFPSTGTEIRARYVSAAAVHNVRMFQKACDVVQVRECDNREEMRFHGATIHHSHSKHCYA